VTDHANSLEGTLSSRADDSDRRVSDHGHRPASGRERRGVLPRLGDDGRLEDESLEERAGLSEPKERQKTAKGLTIRTHPLAPSFDVKLTFCSATSNGSKSARLIRPTPRVFACSTLL
jgi:hypothetical protein